MEKRRIDDEIYSSLLCSAPGADVSDGRTRRNVPSYSENIEDERSGKKEKIFWNSFIWLAFAWNNRLTEDNKNEGKKRSVRCYTTCLLILHRGSGRSSIISFFFVANIWVRFSSFGAGGGGHEELGGEKKNCWHCSARLRHRFRHRSCLHPQIFRSTRSASSSTSKKSVGEQCCRDG